MGTRRSPPTRAERSAAVLSMFPDRSCLSPSRHLEQVHAGPGRSHEEHATPRFLSQVSFSRNPEKVRVHDLRARLARRVAAEPEPSARRGSVRGVKLFIFVGVPMPCGQGRLGCCCLWRSWTWILVDASAVRACVQESAVGRMKRGLLWVCFDACAPLNRDRACVPLTISCPECLLV